MEADPIGLELQSLIRDALGAAEESFDVRRMEPALVAFLGLTRSDPDRRTRAGRALAGLVVRLRDTPPPSALVELLGYCVHCIDLPDVLASAGRPRTSGWPSSRGDPPAGRGSSHAVALW